MDGQHPASYQSICHVKAAEVYPKPTLLQKEPGLKIPFDTLSGEAVEALGRTVDGVLALSNYRFYVETSGNSFHNIPLGAVESVECRDLVFLYVFCKDGRSLRCSFLTNERCQEWVKRLVRATAPPKQIEDHFAFAFHAWAFEENEELLGRLSAKQKASSFLDEVHRMKFNLNGPWRISEINANYNICPSYPPLLLVPASVTDSALEAIAKFRVASRLPVVVWRHASNGAVIARSSQPEVGLLWWRSADDEEFIFAVRAACAADTPPSNKPKDEKEPSKNALIMDARSFSTAFVNRARGGGVECNEYYQDCDIEFMNLPNIHTIRKSFQTLRLICGSPDIPNWWTLLDNTKWLHYIAGLISAAVIASDAIDKHAKPVLVHCSDGWDRTPQIVCLAQVLLDPYYRTIEGFRALVQREWLDFGHKFGDRCGNSVANDDLNDRSPVFLQWLDCLHQLIIQFPCSFQYSKGFLVKLVQHTYSNLFGTFLGNCARERAQMKVSERTFSIWPLLQDPQYVNLLYTENAEVLQPSCDVRDMVVWHKVFQGAPTKPSLRSVVPEAEVETPSRTPECEKDSAAIKDFPMPKLVAGRRNGNKILEEEAIGEFETESLSNENNVPLNKDTDETDMPIGNSLVLCTNIPVKPTRKNRTISEELYERYVGSLDRSSICDSVENLNELTISQESSNSSGTIVNFPNDDANSDGCTSMTNEGKRMFDIDGLETPVDSVQYHIKRILSEERNRIHLLEQELQATRLALVKRKYPNAADECSRSVSLCESEANSSSQPSVHSLPSDLSWEAVEERDVRTTLWVPDHAVSTCPGCNSLFWIGRRKHHCRKCGNIFCSDCSEHRAILPGEDLYYPVRVCNSCHSQVEACCSCSSSASQSFTTAKENISCNGENMTHSCLNGINGKNSNYSEIQPINNNDKTINHDDSNDNSLINLNNVKINGKCLINNDVMILNDHSENEKHGLTDLGDKGKSDKQAKNGHDISEVNENYENNGHCPTISDKNDRIVDRHVFNHVIPNEHCITDSESCNKVTGESVIDYEAKIINLCKNTQHCVVSDVNNEIIGQTVITCDTLSNDDCVNKETSVVNCSINDKINCQIVLDHEAKTNDHCESEEHCLTNSASNGHIIGNSVIDQDSKTNEKSENHECCLTNLSNNDNIDGKNEINTVDSYDVGPIKGVGNTFLCDEVTEDNVSKPIVDLEVNHNGVDNFLPTDSPL